MQMGCRECGDSDDTDYDGATLCMRLPDMLIRRLITTKLNIRDTSTKVNE